MPQEITMKKIERSQLNLSWLNRTQGALFLKLDILYWNNREELIMSILSYDNT